jgi:hypothetical protein
MADYLALGGDPQIEALLGLRCFRGIIQASESDELEVRLLALKLMNANCCSEPEIQEAIKAMGNRPDNEVLMMDWGRPKENDIWEDIYWYWSP